MAGYLRELLSDLAIASVHEAGSDAHHAMLDIEIAISSLRSQHRLSEGHLLALDLFYSGNRGLLLTQIPNARELLSYALKQIASTAGHEYSDEHFIDKALTRYPKYGKIKQALVNKLENYGDTLELD